jgi:single-strand DNA-binding protein
MPAYNKVILVGNLTRDPEIRYIASGSAVTKFAIAVNRKTKQGDETMYVDIVAWEKLGETCNTYLKKGMPVLVEGRLVIRSYDNKDGVKMKATEVIISEMQMLSRKDENGGYGGGSSGGGYDQRSGSAQRSQRDLDEDYGLDEEIPF